MNDFIQSPVSQAPFPAPNIQPPLISSKRHSLPLKIIMGVLLALCLIGVIGVLLFFNFRLRSEPKKVFLKNSPGPIVDVTHAELLNSSPSLTPSPTPEPSSMPTANCIKGVFLLNTAFSSQDLPKYICVNSMSEFRELFTSLFTQPAYVQKYSSSSLEIDLANAKFGENKDGKYFYAEFTAPKIIGSSDYRYNVFWCGYFVPTSGGKLNDLVYKSVSKQQVGLFKQPITPQSLDQLVSLLQSAKILPHPYPGTPWGRHLIDFSSKTFQNPTEIVRADIATYQIDSLGPTDNILGSSKQVVNTTYTLAENGELFFAQAVSQ